jgi:hypothetical protein
MTADQTYATFNATGGSNTTLLAKFATWYDDLECDAALVSEVFRYSRVLKELGHLRVGAPPSHGRQDVGVITKRRPLHWTQRQMTDFVDRGPGSDKPLLWHDRWATRVVTGPLGKDRIVLVSGHAPAVIQSGNKDGALLNNPGAHEWREHGLPRLERMLQRDMDRNLRVRHGWDANQRPGTVTENPAQMYARLGMEWINDGQIWFAFNPRRDRLVRHEVLPTPPGSDGHKTLLAMLRQVWG